MGHAARGLDRVSRTFAGTVPAVISVSAGLLALVVVPADDRPAAALAVALLAVWRTGLAVAAWRGRAAALIPVDVALTGALALAQCRVDAPHLVADSAGWVQAVVVASAVSYPWLMPRAWAALVAAAVLAGCFGAGAVLATGPAPTAVLLPAVWVFGDAAISAGACRLLRHGAHRADEASDRRERARAAGEIAAARRAAEREHLAALHDTAAATLLVVGTGAVAGDPGRIAEQAARDLDVLRRTAPPAGGVTTDLAVLLRDTAALADLDVRLGGAERPVRLPAPVAAALADAVGEALRNVRRHAGVGDATVTVRGAGHGVRVDVTDTGRGLRGVRVDVGRHGRGVRHSIVGRLAAVGGAATVADRPGGGVRVRLEWPGGAA